MGNCGSTFEEYASIKSEKNPSTVCSPSDFRRSKSMNSSFTRKSKDGNWWYEDVPKPSSSAVDEYIGRLLETELIESREEEIGPLCLTYDEVLEICATSIDIMMKQPVK